MALLLRDFVTTTLATAPSGTTGTTLTVRAGDGALFPAVPVGGVIPAVIEAVDGSTREAVMVTGRTGDSFTVTRSSAPVAWSGSGQVFYLALTAAAIDELKKASGHSVVPAGGIAATDVQAALEELDADIAAVAAARAATQAEVDVVEASLATAQSAISGLISTVATKAATNNPTFTGTVTLAQDAVGVLEAVTKRQLDAAAANQLGRGQTWTAVSRTNGTTYTNSTGKPIMVNAWLADSTTTGTLQLVVGGVVVAMARLWSQVGGQSVGQPFVSAVVPAGATYRVEWSGSIGGVVELR